MIVDASVAIQWLVPEPESQKTDSLLAKGGLVAPDLISAEVANAIWKKLTRREVLAIPPSFQRFSSLFDRLEPMSGLAARACEIALELAHPAYDCFYLALAEKEASRMVTVDQRLVRKVASTRYAALVEPLGGAAL